MINLIPPVGVKTVRREYLMRVVAAWCLVFSTALLASALLLLPTYVLLSKQIGTIVVDGADSSSIEAEYTKISQELGKARSVADQLLRTESVVPASEIVRHIESARPSAVSVHGITITYEGGVPHIAALGGARTRDDLRAFVDALKRDAFFTEVVVPVSDLAKDKDPVFSVTLTLREQKPNL